MQGKKVLWRMICGIATSILATNAFSYGCLLNPCGGCISQPCGWYIEGNVGTARIGDDNFNNFSSSKSGCNVSYNGNLGYKFMPYFAIEGGYTRYSSRTIKDGFGDTLADIDRDMYDLAAKGILPIMDSGFELFAKLGVQRLNAKVQPKRNRNPLLNNIPLLVGITSSSHTHYDYFLGIGAQYYLWPELAIVVQWNRAQGASSTGTADLFSVGVSFIFA